MYMYIIEYYSVMSNISNNLSGMNSSQLNWDGESISCYKEWGKSEKEKHMSYINAYIMKFRKMVMIDQFPG